MKPYSESCDQNKEPILGVLREQFAGPGKVLEIGSGTGQHAVYFSQKLPHLCWLPSDIEENLAGINIWRAEANLTNLLVPICLDVSQDRWPVSTVEYIFSANTVHIMSWPVVKDMFIHIGGILGEGGRFCLYGPFNYGERYTSASNASFDAWLKLRDPDSGIRDFEDLQQLSLLANLSLIGDYDMPANNRTLVWKTIAS
jgi:SAM-dependent methyltransferase